MLQRGLPSCSWSTQHRDGLKRPSSVFAHLGLLAGLYHEPCGEAPKSAYEGKGSRIIEVAQNSCQ
jgi:hypothetical protein